MLTKQKKYLKGDTIIEVLFAVTIFSALAISGISVMNRSVGTAQRSLEISLVRQEMNNQAEILRFVHDAFVGGSDTTQAQVWKNIISPANVIPDSQLATLNNIVSNCAPPSQSAFVINPKTIKLVTNGTANIFQPAQIYSQLRYNEDGTISKADGIWVQQLKGENGGAEYRDFHIRACWQAPGGKVPVTLSTVVRLYVPS